ncbi:MAG: hypothetical protein KF752_13755 [Pirellulaceae bacterium]|nr:hypothetical protein [Pirellulaceae bacterium]
MLTSILMIAVLMQPAAEAEQPGAYVVASTTIDYTDSERDNRRLKTEIWYPVSPASSEAVSADQAKPRLRNVPCADGEFPVIMFSHGSQATRLQSTELCEHWASHGYIVVAPDHQFNTFIDHDNNRMLQTALDRPRDISFVLDQVERRHETAGDLLYRKLRLDRIAAIGHSFGGYTSLVLGGAEVDFQTASRRFGAELPEKLPGLSDSRIQVVVSYAPIGPPVFNATGLAELKKPTLVFGGTLDTILPYQTSQVPIYEHAGGTCYLAGLVGGSHFSFNNAGVLKLIQMVQGEDAREEIDRAEADRLVRGITLAFLDRHLIGTDRWGQWLADHPPHIEFSQRLLAK